MQPDVAVIGFTDKGSVVLLPEYAASFVGRSGLLEQAVYLHLAMRANRAAATLTVEGVRVSVSRGEWFGSRLRLGRELRLHKRTLGRVLHNLQAIGAIAVMNVEKTARRDGANSDPSWVTKGPIGRVVGAHIKVFGWKDFRAAVSKSGHGSQNAHQVKSIGTAAPMRLPRLSAQAQAVNRRALAVVESGAL